MAYVYVCIYVCVLTRQFLGAECEHIGLTDMGSPLAEKVVTTGLKPYVDFVQRCAALLYTPSRHSGTTQTD
jgi:hypothetical protein